MVRPIVLILSFVFSLLLAHSASAQQRVAFEGLPADGWLSELLSSRRFVASADLRGGAWSRFDPTRDAQAGLEGVISVRLRGGVDDYTFLRLRSELIVPLMFALNDDPTRTDQWWQGIHNLWAQLGLGGPDTTGFDVFLDARFNHAQEASMMGLSFQYAPADLGEVSLGLTGRVRFARWAETEGEGRWHPGLPVRYRVRRQGYGSDLPLDVRLTHEVSVGLDARSVGQGALTGQVEAIGVSAARTDITTSTNGQAQGMAAENTVDQLEVKVMDTDLTWRRADSAQVFSLRAAAGWLVLWNRDSDTTHQRYTLRVGGQLTSPDRYTLGLFVRALEPGIAFDPRVFYNGSRVELNARLEQGVAGFGFQQRTTFDQACEDDTWICALGDAQRLAAQQEMFWAAWGGEGGVFYRAHHDALTIAETDWTMASNRGADWAHEAGLFWRMTLAYEPHPILNP